MTNNQASQPVTVAVLAGGTSAEREVSLRSGAAVQAALEAKGYAVLMLDPHDGLSQSLLEQADVAFPVLHGIGGEDGSIQSLLDELKIAYVGTGAKESALCFDKWQYKQLLREHNLPVPDGALVNREEFAASPLTERPFVLKPNDGGSSVDTIIARDGLSGVDEHLRDDIFARHGRMLLEELIPGTEITVAVLDGHTLPVIEIVPPESGEFDYDNKYNGKSQELCPPQTVDPVVQQKAQALAAQIHTLVGCRDFSRTDMMIDSDQNLYVLETNTIPGMTDQSLFPKAAATAGIPMSELTDMLVRAALARRTAKS
nr:D-ala D-ala ligase C-terminus [uncultured bacterium]